MTVAIASIVEGKSEVNSVPVLLKRALARLGELDVEPARPFRVKRNRVVREGELERAIRLVVSDRQNVRCVIILLDADDDCPADLGPSLLERSRRATQLPVAVVLANRELEGWFLGAKESLRGVRNIRRDADAPPNPEGILGAKERLSANMQGERRYVEVDDQPALAERMDFQLARQRCPSFDKFLRDVQGLVAAVKELDA